MAFDAEYDPEPPVDLVLLFLVACIVALMIM